MEVHSHERKKELGAYYTPVYLSQVLSDWAIRDVHDKILEPSFGGCGFLEAIVSTLTNMGCKNPTAQVFGADIDITAFDFLSKKLGKMIDVNSGHFVLGDFLNLTLASFKEEKFDVVIGNPPYVSIHNMHESQRNCCVNAIKSSPFVENQIGMNASLWAYFLIHSMQFLNENGRIAWVLPSSVLTTDYAKNTLAVHQKHFTRIKLVKLYERYFQYMGANEVSVILIAEGFQESPLSEETKIDYCSADNISSLTESFEKNNTFNFHQNYKLNEIPFKTAAAYMNMEDGYESISLDKLCTIRIGMVTGDNKTFIINTQRQKQFGLLHNYLKPVVRTFSQLNGLEYSLTKHLENKKDNESCLLVCPKQIRKKHTSIRSYLAKVPREKRKNNQTFPKRSKWYFPDDGKSPDAFFSYMIDSNPRMVLNKDKINCTNSIHRIYFNENLTEDTKKAISVSLLSSFSQLSAELAGRSYGSGVLKLEPSAVKQIKVVLTEDIINSLSNIYTEINTLVEKKMYKEATAWVDEVICTSLLIPIDTFRAFSEATDELRKERYRGLNKSNA